MQRRTRAALLVVIVTLSAIGSLPLGTQATTVPSDSSTYSASVDSDIVAQAEADDDLDSGESFWQGWELSVDASGFLEGGESLEVWLVSEDGQLSQRVKTVNTDADGIASIPTGSLLGRYVLRYNDQPVYVYQGEAYLENPPDDSAVSVETSAFQIDRQTLSFELSDPEVFPGQSTVLTPVSNRERFVVALSAANLTFQNLTTLVPQSAYADVYDARASNNQILVEFRSAKSIRLNTAGLAPGAPEISARVVDTTARGGTTLTVKRPAQNRRILSIERHENVGDVFEVELACSDCHLIVGTPEQGVLDIVELRDSNGDGRVRVRINTRYAGQYTGASGYQNDRPQYTSPNDEVERYSSGSTLEQVEEELSYAVNTAGKLRDRLGLAPTGLTKPIEPGRLQLTVASTDFLIPRSAWGDQPPYGSELVIRDETDARTVELRARSLDGIQTMAVPGAESFEPSVEALRRQAASRQQVALGDRLVFRIDISGVFGYLEAAGLTVDTLQRNEAEGIDLALHRLADGTDERLLFARVGVRFVPDPSNDALYVVFGTGEERQNYLEKGRYRLTLNLEGVSSQYDGYSTQNAYRGYPYLVPGTRETASATVTLEPAEASITAPAVGSSPRLPANRTLRIQGTTTLAAGTDLRVQVEAIDYAWGANAQATVDGRGRWVTSVNLAEAPGEQFAVTVSLGEQSLAEETYTILPPTSEGTPTGSTQESPGGQGTPGEDGSPGGAGGKGTPGGEGKPSGNDGSVVPGIPNVALFGGIVFLLVVIGLVVRVAR